MLSEGTTDSLKTYQQLLCSANNINDMFSIFYKFFYYKLVFPIEFCYSILYPLKVDLVNKTYKINNIILQNYEFKRLLIKYKIDTLFIGSGASPSTQLLEYFKIKKYCFLSKYLIKNKMILINRTKIKLKNLIISEEIINLKNIKKCYGILSTSTFYALLKKKSVFITDNEFLEGNFFINFF